jgi:hypothetical protein
VPNLFEASNGFPHDRNFFWSVANVLDCNGGCIACHDDTFIIFDGYPDPAFVEYGPILLYEVIDPGLEGVVKMGEIQLLAEPFAMKSFAEGEVKVGVNLVKWQSWMPQFLKDGTTINIVKESIILVGLVGIAPIISKDVSDPAVTFSFLGYMDDVAGRECRR